MKIRLSELALLKLESLSEFLVEKWSEESKRKKIISPNKRKIHSGQLLNRYFRGLRILFHG